VRESSGIVAEPPPATDGITPAHLAARPEPPSAPRIAPVAATLVAITSTAAAQRDSSSRSAAHPAAPAVPLHGPGAPASLLDSLAAAAAAFGGSFSGLFMVFTALFALVVPRVSRRLCRLVDRPVTPVRLAVLERPG
jgi:hypothetical protein